MKKFLLWLLLAIPITSSGQFAPDTAIWPYVLPIEEMKSIDIYKKFIRFVDEVEKSRVRMNTLKEVHIAILPASKRSPLVDGEAWSMRLDGKNNFGICITKKILMDANHLWLENIAQHEICHIMLGHLDHGDLVDIEDQLIFEVEAMACTQEYLGEKKTIQFLAQYLFGDRMSKKDALENSREYAKILADIH